MYASMCSHQTSDTKSFLHLKLILWRIQFYPIKLKHICLWLRQVQHLFTKVKKKNTLAAHYSAFGMTAQMKKSDQHENKETVVEN